MAQLLYIALVFAGLQSVLSVRVDDLEELLGVPALAHNRSAKEPSLIALKTDENRSNHSLAAGSVRSKAEVASSQDVKLHMMETATKKQVMVTDPPSPQSSATPPAPPPATETVPPPPPPATETVSAPPASAPAPPPGPPVSPEQAKQQEEKIEGQIEQQEKSPGMMSGLASIGGALMDPVGKMRGMKEMQTLEGLLREALNLQPAEKRGMCLMDNSEFDGLGCSDKYGPPICTCGRLLEICYKPADAIAVARKFTTNQKEGLDEAKALIYGKCQRPLYLVIPVVVVCVLVVLGILFAISKLFKKKAEA